MPPNLDLPRSSRLIDSNSRLDGILDLFYGVACVLDPNGTVQTTSQSWDDVMGRTGRPELLRNQVQGRAFLDLLPGDDELRTAFCFSLASLAEGKQKYLVQPADYSTAGRPFALNFILHAVRENGELWGYIVQGVDITHDAAIRTAFLDRQRRLRDLKTICAEQKEEIKALKEQLDARAQEPEPAVPVESEPARPEAFRVLAAGLSEEFSNLLTGVLGHSSLAAAEIGESHAARDDIMAIERAARNAARLTRRLSAICGAARKATSPIDLCQYIKQYADRDHADKLQVYAPDFPCPAWVDAASLDVILDGMAQHARSFMNNGTPAWTVAVAADAVMLTLSYEGMISMPAGWNDDHLPTTHVHAQIPELFFAREAARIHGGDILLRNTDEAAEVVLTLPPVQTETSF